MIKFHIPRDVKQFVFTTQNDVYYVHLKICDILRPGDQ